MTNHLAKHFQLTSCKKTPPTHFSAFTVSEKIASKEFNNSSFTFTINSIDENNFVISSKVKIGFPSFSKFCNGAMYA